MQFGYNRMHVLISMFGFMILTFYEPQLFYHFFLSNIPNNLFYWFYKYFPLYIHIWKIFFFINDKISNGIFFFLGKIAKIFFSWSKILKFSFIPLVDLRKLRNTLVNVLIVNFIFFFNWMKGTIFKILFYFI